MSFNTLFGKVPEDWTISKIGDIAELRQGLQIASKKRLQSQELGSIPLLKITDLPRKVFSEYVKDIPVNYIATKEDIIYTRTGQVGLVYTDVEGCVHNNCFKVILDYNKFDKKYMYYYLNSPQVREYANIIASGSVQKDLTHKAFKIIKVAYPSLKEQKAIADILSSLDEKIELNNQMNETLEEMAQALFKRWFVDFEFPNEDGQPYKSSGGEMVESELGMIPDKWKIITLKDVAALTMGVSPSSDSYNNSEEGLPLINGAADFKGKNISPGKYTSSPKKICELGDMIFGVRATIGNTVFADKQYAIGRGVAALRPIKNVDKEVIFYQLEYAMEKLVNSASGSVFSNLKKGDIESVKFAYYQPIVQQFHNIVNPIVEKIIFNDKETLNLTLIRDALLPKLMSGEIRVSDFES
ncbi:restriction endonuclease subunit S [Turicibacter bilis]|uniref:Restriction endonuclease subunit S n=1 Tax=Turicibacter bilis TaxID=2735723 RepID=A0A9Q9CFE8_9FIRM|nr:restriction endonuclease subunit S [Turicibacter bilis]MBS3197967.1 restriction endonuclease subunit S [Turicibacter bilis]UUF07954.1 restriction endonuclease subunit S [Turicibacter bilis]